MINNFKRSCRILAVLALAFVGSAYGVPRETTVVRTNTFDRWITNHVNVTVPRNIFVDAFKTNYLTVYQTNVVNVTVTNMVPVFSTNIVQAWATNTKMIRLTNLSTVLVLRTNYINQTATNVVQLDLPRPVTAPPPAAAKPAAVDGQIIVEASWSRKRVGSNLLPIKLTAKDAHSDGTLVITGWRVQNQTGAITSFGKGAEFKRELPPGRYSVEITSQRGTARPMTSKTTVVVDETHVTIPSQPLALR